MVQKTLRELYKLEDFIYVGNGYVKGDATSPFRVRLFKIDTLAGPGEELTKDIIITSAKNSDAWFDVDISSYNIQSLVMDFLLRSVVSIQVIIK